MNFTNLTLNISNQTFINEHDDIGGILYLLKNLGEYLPYTILGLVATIAGIIGKTILGNISSKIFR